MSVVNEEEVTPEDLFDAEDDDDVEEEEIQEDE